VPAQQQLLAVPGDGADARQLGTQRQEVAVDGVRLEDGAHALVDVAVTVAGEFVKGQRPLTKIGEGGLGGEAVEPPHVRLGRGPDLQQVVGVHRAG